MRYSAYKSGRYRYPGCTLGIDAKPIRKGEIFPRESEKFALDGHRDYPKLAGITEEDVPRAIAEYYTFVASEMSALRPEDCFVIR